MFKGRIWPIAIVLTILVVILLHALVRRRPVASVSAPPAPGEEAVVVLPADKCVTCHHRQTPTIVEQWARSRHALENVLCGNCHEVARTYPTALEHYGTYITRVITPGKCGECHPNEVRQFAASRHSIPAWAAMVGYKALTPHFQELLDRIPEIRHAPGGGELPVGFVGATRNALYDLEQNVVTDEPITPGAEPHDGRMLMSLACEACHQVGRPNADGTAGNCNTCHLRHRFSLVQVRKPENLQPLPHRARPPAVGDLPGIPPRHPLRHPGRALELEPGPGRLTVADFPAPTCQICHMSGFGPQPTTHNVGDRLSWFLFPGTSSPRPSAAENRARMQSICAECHGQPFIDDLYMRTDIATSGVNRETTKAGKILAALVNEGVLTTQPFDHPIKFTAFDLWHYYGRTAKFGAWMQGPDYTQWHGLYPLLNEMSRMRAEEAALRSGGPRVLPGTPASQPPATQPAGLSDASAGARHQMSQRTTDP